ncbi:MAG: cell division protein FtsI/penicillin-binding protein 2 [Planctomycetota bacterium]
MNSNTTFISASGLRPLSAFVVVAAVLLVVAGRLTDVAAGSTATQPDRVVIEDSDPFPYAIEDGTGRTLALFVPRFDLEMSPRSMWQAHTPLRMAQVISEALGGTPGPADLLDAMFPDAIDGQIEVDAWDLTPRQALHLQEWIDSGAGSGQGKLDGIHVLATKPSAEGQRPRYHLAWKPERLLSEGVREQHGHQSAWSWARALAQGLDSILGDSLPEEEGDAPLAMTDERRAVIWRAMIPSGFARPVKGLPAEAALPLRAALTKEGVSSWQMRVSYARDRMYPCGEHQLFGSWGWVDKEDKVARPREGLELLCDKLLKGEFFDFIEREASTYVWMRDRTVRGERADGYLGFRAGSEPPIVHSTIEVPLQLYVARVLEELKEEHRPAIAMAIVVDVETGDVLAVDGVQAYDVQPFSPLYHAFTPGSTVKIMTMAAALESGTVIDPWTEKVDVGPGWFPMSRLMACSRVINEARGALSGYEPIADFFARSTNAAMVQVGLTVDQRTHHDFLASMGYGTSPVASLGPETPGFLPPLPWNECYTHASVSFGHEMTTSLWQHAQAISAVLRGGVMRPLRVVNAVEQDGSLHAVPLGGGAVVVSPGTSATIRALMEYGAKTGTGRKVQRDDLVMGTKTGTAQKVSTEMCLHVELAARNKWELEGVPATRARLAALRSVPRPHENCYTSSMVIYGSIRGAMGNEARELMVMVVADEPRGKKKFGSDVAGSAAMRILVEALGMTRDGEDLTDSEFEGFAFAPGISPVELDELDAEAVAERVTEYSNTQAGNVDFDALLGSSQGGR